MNDNYRTIPFYQKQVLQWSLLLSLFLVSLTIVRAEGTHDVAPNPTDMVMLLIGDNNYGNFATLGSPAASRLYVQINSPTEVMYLGLSREYDEAGFPASTGNYSFRIRRVSNDEIVHGPYSVNSFVENVHNWQEASGPAVLNNGVGYATDEARYVFAPGEAGLFYIEFISVDHIGFWDFTVADNGVEIPGRVYSRNWAFRTPTVGNSQPECVWDRRFNGRLFSYTTDGFVTQIDFADSGFQGLSFAFAFNSRGPGQSGDLGLDRMSIPSQNLTGDFAEHLIFLAPPDPVAFPDGACGELTVAPFFNCTGPGTYCLDVSVTQPGQVEVVLDINQNGVFDANIDRRLLHRFLPGDPLTTCMAWDGLLGDGTPVDPGANLNLSVNYTQGVQHWAVYDTEFLKNGFCVEPVRPFCTSNGQTNILYWDDRNIIEEPGTGQPKDGRDGCDCTTPGCRTWNNFDPQTDDCSMINDNNTTGYGDKNSLNTWWFANVFSADLVGVPLIDVVIDGPTEICEGETTTLGVNFLSNSAIATLTWTGPNGIIATGPDAPEEIEVNTPGIYTLEVTDVNGCTFSATHELSQFTCPTDLELDITVDSPTADIGTAVTFTITVTNQGPFNAGDFTVNALWPAGIINVTPLTPGGVLSGNSIDWQNLSLEIGESLTLTFMGVVAPAFDYTVHAEITYSAQADPDSTPGNGIDTNGNNQCADDAGDEDDGDCVTVVPPACMLDATIAVSSISCDANGTPSDPDDDLFTFMVVVTGSNSSNGWRSQVNGQTITGGYNQAVTIGPLAIAAGDLELTITDGFFGAACSTTLSVPAPATCSSLCALTVTATSADCNDNGTSYDPADDTFAFTFEVDGANSSGGWIASDGSTGDYGTSYTYENNPLSAGDVTLIFTDSEDNTCSISYTFAAPTETCSPDCFLDGNVGPNICDNNGTPSDPSDDTFTFTLEITGYNTSAGMWSANDPNNTVGAYGTTVTMGPYLISEGSLDFLVVDPGNPDCNLPIFIVPPPACSNDCSLSVVATAAVCDDNGTSYDPSDDTFGFTFEVDGANASGSWVASDGSTGSYGTSYTYENNPLSAGDVTLTFTDSEDNTCSVTYTFAAPAETCSPDCFLDGNVGPNICDNNGTPSDSSDDTFTFTLEITGYNTTSNSWLANDPNNTSGAYGTTMLMGPYPISGGNLDFLVTDPGNPDCNLPIFIIPPGTCSDVCALTLQQSIIQCDDNGTLSDGADDTYTVLVRVTGANAGTGWTSSNGQSGLYGEWVTLGPFPIAGGNVSLTFTDTEVAACSLTTSFVAPAPCSVACEITEAVATNVACNDNGTPTDPTDDTFTFSVTVAGNNLGENWMANDGSTGAYDVPASFGPYLVADGNVNLTFNDGADSDCDFALEVAAPTSCSDQCAIAVSVFNYQCLDNGTPSDPDDDLFTFQLLAEGVNNNGAGWIQPSGNSGTYGVASTQGPFLIADGGFNMLIQDVDDATCTASVAITPPPSCSYQCMIITTVNTVTCDDAGTPDDASDDYYVYTIMVDGVNVSGSWVANDGTTGNYGELVESVPHSYSEGILNVTISDSVADCGETIQINPPTPALFCPEDTNQRRFIGSVQVLQGQLDTADFRVEEAPCFLAFTSTPILLGDRFMEPVDVTLPGPVDTVDGVYAFFFFSDIPLSPELEDYGDADGTGMLFRGDYTGYTDPCCFNMNQPDELNEDEDMETINPMIDTTGMFAQDMHLVNHFTQSLKPGQDYTLVASTYGIEAVGNYAWVVVSYRNLPMTVNSEEVTSTFTPYETLQEDLTYNHILWTQGNPASQETVGYPFVEPLCGLDSLYFQDELDFENNCVDAYIYRTFIMESAGQADSCDQQLTFRRPSIDDIVLPPATVTFQCGDEYEVNENGYPHPQDTGYPLISGGTDYDTLFNQTTIFNLAVSYKDIPNPITTDLTLNLTREWTITDACNGDTLYVIPQQIKIGPFGPPRLVCPIGGDGCNCPSDNVLVYDVDPLDCTATVDIPLAELVGFCDESRIDDWSITTEVIRVVDDELIETIEFEGARSVSNLDRGDYILHYIAVDLDGNVVERSCQMRIADLQVPTAICVSSLTVTVGDNTPNFLYADNLDQGSYDNCDTPNLLMRRFYNEGTDACAGDLAGSFGEWTSELAFECCDAGQTFLVELQVMDADSNVNGCNVLVSVIDEVAPQLTGLETLNLPCSALPLGFEPMDSIQRVDLFGMPEVLDNCTAEIVEMTPELSWDDCDLGSIRRRFVATDAAGNTTAEVYEQMITVNRNNTYRIRFPKDETTDCIAGLDNLEFINGGCGNFTVTYTDVELDPQGEACLRLQRTYLIVNDCEYDGVSAPTVLSRNENCAVAEGTEDVWLVVNNGNAFADADAEAFNQFPPAGQNCATNPAGYWRDLPNVGAWEYTQVISIQDETAPVVTFTPPAAFCTTDESCEALVSVAVELVDACFPERTEVQLFLDQDNDGTNDLELTDTGVLNRTNNSFVIEGSFPIGEHAFVFEATDACSNLASERIVFTVADCFIATPVCATALEVQLAPVIPATDLNGDGILDEAAVVLSATLLAEMAGLDCSGDYAYSVNLPGAAVDFSNTNMVLTCEDRYQAAREIVVRDNAYNPYAMQPDGSMGGPNYQHCTIVVSVQDPNEVCSTCAQSELEIEGVIRTRTNQPMSGVEVQLLIDDVFDENSFTINDGKFEFPQLAFSTNYEVKPYKNDDTRNGVTTLDLIILQRHLLLQQIITDPYVLLAADITNDGEVTTLDLLWMQQLLLDRIETFPANTSWRFVPSEFPLTDIAAEIPDSYRYFNLLVCQFGQDFIGIKIGDLNGSASSDGVMAQAEERTHTNWLLEAPDYDLRTGDIYRIPIRAKDLERLSGLEVELALNTDFLEVLEVEEGQMKAEQMNTTSLQRGLLKGIWVANNTKATASEPLFTLVVEAKASTKLATALAVSGRVPSFAYDHALEAYQLQLQFSDYGQEAVLLKNYPDPFQETTQISFYLPQAGNYLLEITDATGKVVQQYQQRANAGKQQQLIRGEGLPAGVLFYTLTFDGRQISRRMVKM
ncbi:T9SS type A sorting domain-containing protein [Lewinella sp. LCG006]|uniref:T9SS type A sorting domain-containing protein n=1 Tax=Lewinella sp. LCG006 TaxID=3231911 RepID=UPI00345F72B7